MEKVSLEVGTAVYLRAASSYIRMQVFVLEKSLALSDEFDQNDTPDTIYAVLFAVYYKNLKLQTKIRLYKNFVAV